MGLNRLYSDHQRLLMAADQALSLDLRQRFVISASLIAARIGCIQRALGAKAAEGWETIATPCVRYGEGVPFAGLGQAL